ncbi:Uncharacterised protein [Bordetella pertussis]|nr:Uncharacterised protein [Bordetella pertussis]
MVGTSGRTSSRLSEVTAMGWTFLLWMDGSAE